MLDVEKMWKTLRQNLRKSCEKNSGQLFVFFKMLSFTQKTTICGKVINQKSTWLYTIKNTVFNLFSGTFSTFPHSLLLLLLLNN